MKGTNKRKCSLRAGYAARNGAATLILLTLSLACGRRDADVPAAESSDAGPGIIETMTRKTAVDAGQRARQTIEDVDRARQEQFDEVLKD